MSEINFDEQRSRIPGFTVAGERFAVQPVSWEEVALFRDSPDSPSTVERYRQMAEFIEKFIATSDVERWQELVARKKGNVLSAGDLLGITMALLEQDTGRPPTQPASSGRGQVRLPGGSGGAPPSQGSTRGS